MLQWMVRERWRGSRAHLAHAIAQRGYEVKTLARELVQVFGATAAEIDATSSHDAYRLRVERLGMTAGAAHFYGSV